MIDYRKLLDVLSNDREFYFRELIRAKTYNKSPEIIQKYELITEYITNLIHELEDMRDDKRN